MKWVRLWLVFSGGMLVGAGLVLHAQVAMAEYVRDEVQSVFFLWRGVAQLTFIFQGDMVQAALFLNDVPPEVLVHSDRMAWTLSLFGVLFLITAPQIRKRRAKRKRGTTF